MHSKDVPMTHLLDDLPTMTDRGLVNVVVDTPSGSAAKFKFDAQHACYRLSRLLPAGMAFPYNFGSIPRTLASHGDPLDLLVLATTPLFVGCLVEVKPVCVLLAEQSQSGKTIRNDRLIGAAVTEVNAPLYESMDAVGPIRLAEIEHFFISYNRAHGRDFKPLRRGDASAAQQAIQEAESRYREARK
jgi:inorganic pyrophosphatase